MRRTATSFLVALLPLATTRASAQAVAVDSQVVRIASATLETQLAPIIAEVTKDAPPKTWLLAFPEENAAAWLPVGARLLSRLNGRPAAGADTVLQLATVSQLSVIGDSLMFNVSVGSQWKCEGHWRGKGTVTTYVAHWIRGVWSPPLKSERHVFDSDPC